MRKDCLGRVRAVVSPGNREMAYPDNRGVVSPDNRGVPSPTNLDPVRGEAGVRWREEVRGRVAYGGAPDTSSELFEPNCLLRLILIWGTGATLGLVEMILLEVVVLVGVLLISG